MSESLQPTKTGKKRWHKPTLYDLTAYIDTGGGPTAKVVGPTYIEDEAHPDPYSRNKNYVPATF